VIPGTPTKKDLEELERVAPTDNDPNPPTPIGDVFPAVLDHIRTRPTPKEPPVTPTTQNLNTGGQA
jgi:hypothetical protein